MNNFSVIIIIISIIIIFSCGFYKSLKEGLTNNDNIILLGDSVLNNSLYVPSGKTVEDYLKKNTSNVFNYAKDGATINDLYSQLDKVPLLLVKTNTYIFISIGGNDILNKRGQLDNNQIKILFTSYMNFLKALRVKLSSAKINILNLYIPSNPRYFSYKDSIEEWNNLIKQNSNKIGEMYNIINLYSLLTTPNDFVYDIEPSEIASSKIANVIYLS
jgi:hypothetical protein